MYGLEALPYNPLGGSAVAFFIFFAAAAGADVVAADFGLVAVERLSWGIVVFVGAELLRVGGVGCRGLGQHLRRRRCG